jgi:hypothetical protein
MWTSTSKVIQSNEVQKEKIQLDLDFPKSITTSIRDRDPAACREKAPHGDLLFPRLVNK